jgi:hypothetical protein
MTTAQLSKDTGTTGFIPHTEPIPGYVSSQQLHDSLVYSEDGPTGHSVLWAEQLSTLMHHRVTTDSSFNQVDAIWMREGTVVFVQVKVLTPDAEPEPIRPVEAVVNDLRARLGMSVEDMATMCGVGRRQLYNLMSGSSTSTGHEAHIRRLAHLVDQLSAIVDGSPQRLRSIALHPIDGTTFYEAAQAQDPEQMDAVTQQLLQAIDAGKLSGVVNRPSPRSRAHMRPGTLAELYGDDDTA